MAAEACSDSRSWEEEMYWTHFQYTQFSQVLHSGFDQRLAIPEKLSENLRKRLPGIVTVKGPSGNTWKVGLTTNNNIVYFNDGWEEFVKDHFLQEKDLLVFKYNGNSHFDVLTFDGQSLCEKAASYFVRKCGHRECNSGCQTGRKIGESSTEIVPTTPHDFLTPLGNTANNDTNATPPGQPIASQSATKRTQRVSRSFPSGKTGRSKEPLRSKARREIKFSDSVHVGLNERSEETCLNSEEMESKPDVQHTPMGPNVVHDVPYVSIRRQSTEEKKRSAIQLAEAALSKEGFLVVMKPSHVYRKFYMETMMPTHCNSAGQAIPAVWLTKHLSALVKYKVILRVKENTWCTKFYYQKGRRIGGLSAGWKSFAVDNNLQEFDVCVFEPSYPMASLILLDVTIFRVSERSAPAF